ncbi:hypothetical protein C8A01DRAFT_50586 [Parachaetomium inaequale]|uniref:Uncharacterized protein n=1 Tax=Parachaetomium inaequale TaxID=2588326 RepID=A0AAN6P6I8_9PEZI|nr:hypothetical protein C8A01DRAFT_50586 [Parachaetomium inaequale]
MVKFTSVVVALAATITGAQAAFTKACNAPYDVCGWTLTNTEFGYDQATLAAAATAAGQDASSGTILFDAIYNCGADGVIAWNHHCANGCDGAIQVPNANCRA